MHRRVEKECVCWVGGGVDKSIGRGSARRKVVVLGLREKNYLVYGYEGG